jgi:aminopeptidase N
MRGLLACAIAAALAAGPVARAAQPPAMPEPSTAPATTQLPRTVRPTHYDIAIEPHAQAMTFAGHATIAIDVLVPTDRITLNAADLAFTSAALLAAEGKAKLAAPTITLDAPAQTATFTFATPLHVGAYRLALDYTGRIGTLPSGLFAIDYDTAAGKRRALFTQFEAADARRFIPSWDEPAYKATFTLEATVPTGQMAVSNLPPSSTADLGDGRTRVRFATSPKMSTYLLFFATGDFERATTHEGATEVGVVTQRGALGQAAFALESSRAVLAEYNDYFGVPYPLPKLDNVASPGRSQFFGAMENWGAIYTFEYALLLDPSISTQSDRQAVFSVAAHEVAHQWFGNLVTMQWWDDLWLNEGFASWMESRTSAKLHPEWNTALADVGTRERAMSLDAVASTHPVVQHVETVEQAGQAFDSITYSKGEAVIRMLEGYVGAEAWRDGVRRYMKAHAHGNTVSDDLWREIEAAAGKPILAIARDFTTQPGVPLIRVGDATCAGGNTTLSLTQGEFTKDRPDKAALAWRVPVIAQVVGNPAAGRALVTDGQATLTVPGCGPVIVNAGQSGYYRTLYTTPQFDALRDGFAQLASIDQLGLMNDTWALGMAGLRPASDYLDLAAGTPVDADPQVWGDVVGSFTSLDDYYRDAPERQARFRRFAIARLAPVLARVGWDARPGESDPQTILRTQLIGALATLGDADVIAEARRRYAAQATDPAALPVALRKTVLGIVALHADAATWDQLHAAAKAETTPLKKDDLYDLLASTLDESLARRALELALTDEPGATNSGAMIETVANRHPDLAFDFVLARLPQVDKLVDASLRSSFYPGLADSSLDAAMVARLRAYADAHVATGSRRPTESAIANILYRTRVRDARLPAVDAWLAQHGG